MSHLMIVLFIVGAFALILATVKAVRAYFEKQRELAAPFRNYFGSKYDRDLIRQSSWSDDENLYGFRTRYAVIIRDQDATERYSSGGGRTWGNRGRS